MQQMTGMDGIFLGFDATPVTNAMIGCLLKYNAPDAEAGGRERMIERITERLDAIPPYRWAMTSVPIGINNTWLHEVDVDVPAHVKEYTVDAPGDDHALAKAVAEIMMTPRPKGPMWDLTIIRGLPDNQLAHLFRISHGVIDGGTMQTVIDLLSDEPVNQADPRDARPLQSPKLPVKMEIVARGLANQVLAPVRVAALAGPLGKFIKRRADREGVMVMPALMARMMPGELGKPLMMIINGHQKLIKKPEVHPLIPTLKVPSTSFNARITERRNFAFADHALADFKDTSKTLGVSLNDIVLACFTGALRLYLQDHGGVPDRPLICSVPISLRTGEEKERWANHVSGFWAELPTHIEDPMERLQAVHDDIQVGKDTFNALPREMLRDSMRVMLPMSAWAISYKLLEKAPDWYPGTFWNVVVSNVPGPRKTINMCGAEMTGFWPVGFLNPGAGLNVVLQSYKDRLDFGFLGCPDLMPDLWELPGHMETSLGELKAVAAERVAQSS